MLKKGTSLETITSLLEIARDFEKKGNRQSALDVYRDVLSRLAPESTLKKEVEIIVEHLEDYSQSTPSPAQRRAIPLLWKIASAFLAGLVLMAGIVILLGRWNYSPSATEAPLTRIAVGSALPASTVTPDINDPAQKASSSETSLPTQNTNFLTVKAEVTYLRAGPHTNHPELLEVRRGMQLEILGIYTTNDGLWFYVKSPEGKEGWLLERWVMIDSGNLDRIPTVAQAQIPTVPVKPTRVPYP